MQRTCRGPVSNHEIYQPGQSGSGVSCGRRSLIFLVKASWCEGFCNLLPSTFWDAYGERPWSGFLTEPTVVSCTQAVTARREEPPRSFNSPVIASYSDPALDSAHTLQQSSDWRRGRRGRDPAVLEARCGSTLNPLCGCGEVIPSPES